jgi:hypothetical protein
MTIDTFKSWLKLLPKPPRGKRGLLVLDVVAARRCTASLEAMDKLNHDPVFIPGGRASNLQVHDASSITAMCGGGAHRPKHGIP